MKKKIMLLVISIISVSMIIIVLSDNNQKYVDFDGVKVAIFDGNGGSLNSVPTKGKYKVTVTCKNAEGSWDYVNWKIVLYILII